AIITFFYIFYANSFLLSLRRKEFGMYMTLGAKKHKVIRLMFLETIITGATSLLIGILVGTGLAQVIGKLLMKQLDFTADGYQALYVPSISVTCIFFCLLFILSAMMNSLKLLRTSILNLVHGDTHADSIIIKGKMTGIVAILSLILLGIGYLSMFYFDKLREAGIMIAMLTTTAGTYLFFEAFFPLFVKKLKANKTRNEKGLNAFTFSQLNFRINSLTKLLATVAMLIALGSGAISGGLAYKNNVMKSTDSFEIYDTIINNPTIEEMGILDGIPFKEKSEYRYKVDDTFVYYVKEDLEKNPPLIHAGNGEGTTDKLRRVRGELPVNSVSVDGQEINQNAKSIPEEWETAIINMHSTYLNYLNKPMKIINLNMYHELKGKAGTIFIGKTDDFVAHTTEWKKLDELESEKYKDVKADDILSKYKIYNNFYADASGIVFMGFFLGIAFLAMMASSLMFKILSGATTDINRYEMLRKIGVSRELLTKSIYKELFIVFLAPAIIGMVHVLIGMNMFGYVLIDPYYRIWLPIVIFLFVYTAYYLITVHLYKRIVFPKKV
ncbi:MAG TPA: ABC transporter permease, partial [Candidatus Avamphibacillus sp.]|nr:ABC transporter permease [Candidatus Avamphibacillus sp.]